MEPVELVVLVELEVLVELAEQSWQHAGIGKLGIYSRFHFKCQSHSEGWTSHPNV